MSEGEVEVRGGQRNDAAEQDGTEGVNAPGGEEVAVDLPEVPDGGCGGDEGADGGRGRGHATERPPAPRKDSALLASHGLTSQCRRGAKHWPLDPPTGRSGGVLQHASAALDVSATPPSAGGSTPRTRSRAWRRAGWELGWTGRRVTGLKGSASWACESNRARERSELITIKILTYGSN